MKSKELMINTLNSLLKENEVLLHAIYGSTNKDGYIEFGYFGFTEEYFLIALLRGKKIIYTQRILLDVNSVKINKTSFANQYIININFNGNAPCIIKTSSNYRQNENFIQFLDYLRNKFPQIQYPKINSIKGDKLRWQYFNYFMYVCLALFTPFFLIALIHYDLATFLAALIFVSPLFLISLFNRFLFGKIVCTVSEFGIHLDNGFIPWSNIKKIIYKIRLSSRSRLAYSHVSFLIKQPDNKEYITNVIHFPSYGLGKVKKYNPQVKIEFDKYSLFLIGMIVSTSIILTIIFVFIPLFL